MVSVKKRGIAIISMFIVFITLAVLVYAQCGSRPGVLPCPDSGWKCCADQGDGTCPDDYNKTGLCNDYEDKQCCLNDGYKWFDVKWGDAISSPYDLCCGDDGNEFYITSGVGQPGCCVSAFDCVDAIGACRDGTESCDDNVDDDCDNYADERDDSCTISLKSLKQSDYTTCSEASYLNANDPLQLQINTPFYLIVKSISGTNFGPAGTVGRFCDYQGCNSDGTCKGTTFDSVAFNGATGYYCRLFTPGISTPGIYGYYFCIDGGKNSDNAIVEAGESHCSNNLNHAGGDETTPAIYKHWFDGIWNSWNCNNYDCTTPNPLNKSCSTGDIHYIGDDYRCEGVSPNGNCVAYAVMDCGIVQDCVDTCTDSDGGNDYLNQGAITDNNLCQAGDITCPLFQDTDACTAAETLKEYYCSGTNYASETKNCNDYENATYKCIIEQPNASSGYDDWVCAAGRCMDSGNDGKILPGEECNATNECMFSTIANCSAYQCHYSGAVWEWATSLPATEDFCSDGYDNDCDGWSDGQDSDCVVFKINGNVYNATDNRSVGQAKVQILGETSYQTFTNTNGYYDVEVVDHKYYDVAASKPGFEPEVEYNIYLDEPKNIDFYLTTAESNCRSDCTQGDGICHRECDRWNGCYFYDGDASARCDGKTPGMKASYNATHEISCCTGMPSQKQTPIIPVKVEPKAENVVRVSRIVMWEGKPIKMIIDVFG